VIIRDAAEADLPALVEIYNAAVATRRSTAQLEPVSVEQRLPWFQSHTSERYPLWVMENENAIAGWLSLLPFNTRAGYRGTIEVSVYVHPTSQRRGVGRDLLGRAIACSPAFEIRALIGLIFGHNAPSLELFQSFGFERWGFLPRVAQMEGVARDVVILGRQMATA